MISDSIELKEIFNAQFPYRIRENVRKRTRDRPFDRASRGYKKISSYGAGRNLQTLNLTDSMRPNVWRFLPAP